MILKAKDVEKALLKKGFRKDNKDHRRFRLWVDGVMRKVNTMTSHNSQEIGHNLQTMMAMQMYLTKNEFLIFVSCQMTEQDYIERLKAKDIIV